MMPSTGMLLPGQRVNVQVKFMPTEEVSEICSLSVFLISIQDFIPDYIYVDLNNEQD